MLIGQLEALGSIYAAQFHHKLLEEIPYFDQLLVKGNLLPIKEWLTKNIYQYGKLKKPRNFKRRYR